jgi:hypothetical protein
LKQEGKQAPNSSYSKNTLNKGRKLHGLLQSHEISDPAAILLAVPLATSLEASTATSWAASAVISSKISIEILTPVNAAVAPPIIYISAIASLAASAAISSNNLCYHFFLNYKRK